MRKIEENILDAIWAWEPFCKGSTCFNRQAGTSDGWELSLHGNVIAYFDRGSKFPQIPVYITLAGWNTHTTRSRLNALNGVNVKVKAGKIYLNGEEIDDTHIWKVK